MPRVEVISQPQRVDITFNGFRFAGPVYYADGRVTRFCHDTPPFTDNPPRSLMIVRQVRMNYLAHENGIPIIRWSEKDPVQFFFYSVRMLHQRDFDPIHPKNAGQRGVFSPFTGICDLALDNPFFQDDQSGLLEEYVKSTLAHELSHRRFNGLSVEERLRIFAAFTQSLDFWRVIRKEFVRHWGEGMKAPDEEEMQPELILPVLDELLAKACSYRYRPSSAQPLIQLITRRIFAADPFFDQFFKDVQQETAQRFHLHFLEPIRME